MRCTFPCGPSFVFAVILGFSLPLVGPAQGPELTIDAPPSAVSGTLVGAAARIASREGNILSWSLSVAHEGLRVLGASTAETDFDRLSRGGYAESGVHPDGTAYYSIGVLSFQESVTLPAGSSEVLRAACLVTRKEPGEARILPRDGLTLPDDDRVLSNQVLLVGGSAVSLATREKAITVTGCAGLGLAISGAGAAAAGAGDPGAAVRLDLRRGSLVEVNVSVHVESAAHLNPTGFTFGIAHDAAVLELVAAEIAPSLAGSFVKPDGFTRVESSEDGVAASVLSSEAAPAALGPGDHPVLKAVYGFVGNGSAGETIAARISLGDDLLLGGSPAKSVFQPGDALPCELPALDLELTILVDQWVRGDGNADGKADISDAIATLQYLFLGGPAGCLRAMEVNSDGRVDLSDAVALLSHLFTGLPPPAPPFPACGEAEETLPCEKFACPAG